MRSSIRRQILGIAVGLIILMVIVSALSTVMTRKVAHQLRSEERRVGKEC